MKKLYILLIALMCSFSLTGCSTVDFTKGHQLNEPVPKTLSIVDRHINKYVVSTNSNNLIISAILREMANAYITNDFNCISNALSYQSEFFMNITTNVISYHYPIRASMDDIEISQGFIVDIIYLYGNNDNAFRKEVKTVIPNLSNTFIFKINDIEYEKRRD